MSGSDSLHVPESLIWVAGGSPWYGQLLSNLMKKPVFPSCFFNCEDYSQSGTAFAL